MAFGTVSFEELLGHCNEVYKNSENRILEFQDRLGSFGYVPAGTFIFTQFIICARVFRKLRKISSFS